MSDETIMPFDFPQDNPTIIKVIGVGNQSLSARRNNERCHLTSRIQRSKLPAADIWYLHALHRDKIMSYYEWLI